MSSIKNPEDKKMLSLMCDRRNVYGENAKSSRKNIPRSKQLRKQALRNNVTQALAVEITPASNLDIERMDSTVKDREITGKRKQFKKRPDAQLFSVLLKKKTDYRRNAVNWKSDFSLTAIERLRQKLRDR